VVAPGRARRPGAGRESIEDPTQEELDSCPFDGGREDRTPPETLTLGDPWQVRVVPNLYPAFERQEVVVHTPRHVRTLAELEPEELDVVAEAWQRRRAAEPSGYLHALVNEGRAAGASLAHTHSQLVWLREPPPEVARERGLPDTERVLEREGVVLACPQASRVPYELLITPARAERGAFGSDLLAPALRLLGDAVRRLRGLEGPVPWNAWLHDTDPWHIEVFPRLNVLAGIELGAGIYVNTLAPEEAARALRDA
jgi:UDPglucose--hexose-1-phosphate uridylyltransferase